jgi:hypothetical protein
MRVTRALDRVALDGNPIGLDGAAAVMEALARGWVRSLSIAGCNFGGGAAAAAAGAAEAVSRFDIQRPNGTYRLNLACVADYNVAGTLVQYWSYDNTGTNPWKSSSLDGQVRLQVPGPSPRTSCKSATHPMQCMPPKPPHAVPHQSLEAWSLRTITFS